MSKKPTRRATKPDVCDTRCRTKVDALERRLRALESRLLQAGQPVTQFSPDGKSRWWSNDKPDTGTWCFGEEAEHPEGTCRDKCGRCLPSGLTESRLESIGYRRIPRPDWWPQKIEAKQPCEHPDLEYTPDPSGNNDALWECHRCGGKWSRRPRPAKPKTLREIPEAVGRRLKVIGDSTPREIVNDGSRQALLVAAAVCRNRAKQFEASRFHEVEHTVLTALAHDCEQEAKR